MNIREKMEQHKSYEAHDAKQFNRALIRAGFIIIAGYLFATALAWFIVR